MPGDKSGVTPEPHLPNVRRRAPRWAEGTFERSSRVAEGETGREKPVRKRRPHPHTEEEALVFAQAPLGPRVFRSQRNGPAGQAQPVQFTEAEREPFYKRELLFLFRERIRLVALFGILLLPIFCAFYYFLHPEPTFTLAKVHLLLVIALGLLATTTRHLKRLSWARVHALVGYVVFCAGTALAITVARQSYTTDNSAGNAIQFTILASYVHILLSILLLPFSLWEGLVVVLVIVGSVLTGLYWSTPLHLSSADMAQMFVLGTMSCLVLAISHMQSVLRRDAFDATFELARQAGKMQAASATDALTGGFNRRHVEYLLDGELSRSARFGHALSLIMFDLDNFKPVNDNLGHGAGDQVLREIHAAALANLREVDTLARYGGDEFLIVLPETDEEAAIILAERLKSATEQSLKERFGPRARQARVTLSMGILTVQGDHWTMESALGRVDELLYDAKRSGKNQIACNRRRRHVPR